MELLAFLIGVAATIVGVFILTQRIGFQAQKPDDYREGPTFDIRKILSGHLLCDGVIYGPTGRVTSRFIAKFEANWNGDKGIMREHFKYDSGTVQHREWQLSVGPTGQITANADDLVGAGHGQQTGSGVQLSYAIRLPASAGGHILKVTDWMYLLDNGTIINRSQFRKFGLKVGELVATVRPDPSHETQKKAA